MCEAALLLPRVLFPAAPADALLVLSCSFEAKLQLLVLLICRSFPPAPLVLPGNRSVVEALLLLRISRSIALSISCFAAAGQSLALSFSFPSKLHLSALVFSFSSKLPLRFYSQRLREPLTRVEALLLRYVPRKPKAYSSLGNEVPSVPSVCLRFYLTT